MAMLCPPPPVAEIRPFSPLREENAYAQGETAQAMMSQMEQALKHLQDRQGAELSSEDDGEIFEPHHVPLKVVGTVKVRYRLAGVLRPRPLVLEDDDA